MLLQKSIRLATRAWTSVLAFSTDSDRRIYINHAFVSQSNAAFSNPYSTAVSTVQRHGMAVRVFVERSTSKVAATSVLPT